LRVLAGEPVLGNLSGEGSRVKGKEQGNHLQGQDYQKELFDGEK